MKGLSDILTFTHKYILKLFFFLQMYILNDNKIC